MPAEPTPAVNDDARSVVERFIAARNAHDADAAAVLLADEFEWRVARSAGPPMRGSQAINALVGGLEKQLFEPGTVQRKVHRWSVDGGVVVVEYTVTGTTLSGTEYANDYCWVYDVDGGKIVRITSYSDTLGSSRAFGEERLAEGIARTRRS